MKYLIILFVCASGTQLFGQDGIGIGTTKPDASAALDVRSSNKGLLLPRIAVDTLNRPTAPADGLLVYNTISESLYAREAGNWYSVMPRGAVIMWYGDASTAFDVYGNGKESAGLLGWALCNGQNGTPNMNGKFPVAYDSSSPKTPTNQTSKSLNYGVVGNTGGENNHALSVNELAAHKHTVNNYAGNSAYDGSHGHNISWSNGSPLMNNGNNEPDRDGGGRAALRGPSTVLSLSGGNHRHSINHGHTMDNTGGNVAHENRPPYVVMAFIMKIH